MVRYLTADDVVTAHRAVLRAMGLSVPALNDRGKLEGAVMRPQYAAFYADATVIHQAAILAIAISQAQAFEDGNKRAALAAMTIFLNWNGFRLRGSSLDGGVFLVVYAFLNQVPDHGNEPTDAGFTAFCLWIETIVGKPNDDRSS